MISLKELNPKGFPTTPEIDANLRELLRKVNLVRAKRDIPMYTTSGLRSIEDHRRIYMEKAKKENRTIRIPLSKHLIGCAVDFADSDGSLYQWCKSNESFIAECGLWLEEGTVGWVHFQSVPYGSWVEGKTIWFKP